MIGEKLTLIGIKELCPCVSRLHVLLQVIYSSNTG